MSAVVSPDVESPVRGRPREFDADAVLDALVQLFWEQGFEATSMTDITKASGLSKSSLYNAFGSKDELFDQALNRYVDFRVSMVTEAITNGERGLEDIGMFLDLLWSEVSESGDHRGCLAINTSTEFGGRDDRVVATSERYRAAMRGAFRAAFTRAAQLGEIDRSKIASYVDFMVSFMLGTGVIVRSGAPDAEIRRQLDAALAVLDGWRVRP